MDDEEGEEDEEELPLPAKAQKEVSIRRSMAQLTAQDELFHTGEECIDRVAEAEWYFFENRRHLWVAGWMLNDQLGLDMVVMPIRELFHSVWRVEVWDVQKVIGAFFVQRAFCSAPFPRRSRSRPLAWM